jgi:hypothetical protein
MGAAAGGAAPEEHGARLAADASLPSLPNLLGGPGRARETAAVLAALSALDAEGEPRGAAEPAGTLADLEELLLTRRPPEGLLVLDSARVPEEDIGFVRRFLERHPEWRLVVLGADERDARVRALLALPRTALLAWPPDLGKLRALLPAAPSAAPAPVAAPPATGGERRASPRKAVTPTAAAPTNGAVEVGGLVEELLASAALEGDDPPRYQYRAGAPFHVHRERARLAAGLGGLVDLARRCAGADGLVRAGIHPEGDRVRIGLDFPRGALDEKDLPAVLAPANGADSREGLASARRAAALLRELGGQVELVPGEPGRLRCDVRLAAEAPTRRGSKPEDPFA